MKTIDARGQACPAPVLETRAAVAQEGLTEVTVLVDNEAARQNVDRYLASAGFAVEVGTRGQDFVVTGRRDAAGQQEQALHAAPESSGVKIMVMCGTDRLGHGDDDLGRKLMISYIKTLAEMRPDLWRLVFVNSGVKLAISGSAVLEVLQGYEKEGLHILVCGTCLTHFDLLEEKAVGETTNMLDIVTAMHLADKVIAI